MPKIEAYLKTFRKYQMLGWLEDYLKDKEIPGNTKITTIKRKNYVDLLNWMFDNIPTQLPQITQEFIDYMKKTYTSSSGSPTIKIAKKTGLKKLTEEQQDELMTQDDFSDIYTGKKPLKADSEGNFNITTLQEHQKRFLEGFMFGNLKSAIVFHGVGTGKTISGIAVIKVYLQLYKTNKVYIVTPPAVMFNFVDSLIAYGMNPLDKRIEYFSYVKFANANKDLSNALLLVDEAHNLRTRIVGSENNIKSGIRPYKFILKTGNAHKIILMTATPFVNTPYDIENLLAIGDGRFPHSSETFSGIVSNRNNLIDYFKYRISYYMNTASSKFFPENRETYIFFKFEPDSDEGKAIKADVGSVEDKNTVYNKSRVASIEERKIEYIMKKIKDNPTKKYVIYTSFLANGINRIGAELKKINTEYGIVSGTKTTIQKKSAIDAYRNFDNKNWEGLKTRVLIISKAGAEGVNLNNTRGIFIMDGVWNEASYEQIVARAIRYKSHFDLPEKDRFVEVYKMFVVYPQEAKVLTLLNNGGIFDFQRFLDNFTDNKKVLMDVTNKKNKLGRELTKQEYQDVLAKREKKIGSKFEQVELDKLKKGSKERKEYLEQEKEFDKNKAKYETQDTLRQFNKLTEGKNFHPSTDFYMFVLQKTKFLKVEKMIRELGNVPKVEDVIYGKTSKIKEVREFYNSLLVLKTAESVFTKLREYLIPLAEKGSRIIERHINEEGSDIYQYIARKKDIEKAFKDKMKVRINQEFFTPDDQVMELINLSGIRNISKQDSQNLHILEPSAGMGNIIRGLLKIFAVKKINMTIDCVELVKENRDELIKLQQQIPSIINVQNQPDFLKFFPSGVYDYIFMNPPFHLQKRNHKKLIKDVYDYDFVKKAFSFLQFNGVLVAITGRKYKDNPDIIQFYKSIGAKLYDQSVEWKGPNLKAGSEVKKLDITYIYIRKLKVNFDLDRKIQEIKYYIDDTPQEETIRDDIQTNEEVIDNIIEVKPKEEEDNDDYLFDDTGDEEDKKIRDEKDKQFRREEKKKIYKIFDEKNDLQRKNKITNSLPESKNKELNDKILKQIKENSSFDSILNLLLKTDYYVLNRTNGRIKIDNTKISFNPDMIIYQVGRKTKKIFSIDKQKEKDLEGEENNRKIIEMVKEQPNEKQILVQNEDVTKEIIDKVKFNIKNEDLIYNNKDIPFIKNDKDDKKIKSLIIEKDYNKLISILGKTKYKILNTGYAVIKINDTTYFFNDKEINYKIGNKRMKKILTTEAKEIKKTKTKETIKRRKQDDEDIKAGKSPFSNFDDAVKEKRLMDVKNIEDKINNRNFDNFDKLKNIEFLQKVEKDLKELIKDFISRIMTNKDRLELNKKIIEVENMIEKQFIKLRQKRKFRLRK